MQGSAESIQGGDKSKGNGLRYKRAWWVSLEARTVENLPAVRETWVRSLGWEDPMQEGEATHCSILAWRIPWIEEPGRLQSMGSKRAGHD